MFMNNIITIAILAFSLTAQATQIFRNTGTRSGWDSINEEHSGSVQQVTNLVYEGSTALKMTQIYDPSYTGRYHSEVTKNNIYKRGDTGFYGFDFDCTDIISYETLCAADKRLSLL